MTVTGPKWSKLNNKSGTVVSLRDAFVGVDFENVRDIQYVYHQNLRLGLPLSSTPLQDPLKTPTS